MILKMPLKMAFKVVGLTGIWFPKLQSKISPSVKIDAHIQETLCIYILSIWEQPDAAVEIQPIQWSSDERFVSPKFSTHGVWDQWPCSSTTDWSHRRKESAG